MLVKLTDGTIHDSEHDPRITQIDVVNPGVVIHYREGGDDVRIFHPWHKVENAVGESRYNHVIGKHEHELEQFYHLGVDS